MWQTKIYMSSEQELFLVLTRLRLGLLLQDIAHRFNISPTSVSRVFKTWIPFLHQRLCAFSIWPSRKFIDDNMPSCFKQVYPKTCRSQSITFSSYKNHNTAKGLIGISPNGYPSFVSSLYAGIELVTRKSLMTACAWDSESTRARR